MMINQQTYVKKEGAVAVWQHRRQEKVLAHSIKCQFKWQTRGHVLRAEQWSHPANRLDIRLSHQRCRQLGAGHGPRHSSIHRGRERTTGLARAMQ
jgi:hypothetical protein